MCIYNTVWEQDYMYYCDITTTTYISLPLPLYRHYYLTSIRQDHASYKTTSPGQLPT